MPALPAIAAPGSAVWRIDSSASELHILVFRAGALAQLGHNHVIAAGTIDGAVYRVPALEDSTFELAIPVADLTVDSPQLRRRYGEEFASTPTESDISGTRSNMLGPALLDAANYPRIRLTGHLSAAAESYSVELDLMIKATRVQRTVPIALRFDGDLLTVAGSLELRHDELGLEPFSALFGALQVAQVVEIHFAVTARRVCAGQASPSTS